MQTTEGRVRRACVLAALVGCAAGCNDDGGSEGALDTGDGGSAADASRAGTTAAGAATLAQQCPSMPDCGGDPSGSWQLVAGCTEATPSSFDCDTAFDGFEGSVSGSLVLGALDAYSTHADFELEVDHAFKQCGWNDSGGGGVGGDYMLEGDNVLRVHDELAYTFCVQGDALYLSTTGETYPELATLTFQRAAP